MTNAGIRASVDPSGPPETVHRPGANLRASIAITVSVQSGGAAAPHLRPGFRSLRSPAAAGAIEGPTEGARANGPGAGPVTPSASGARAEWRRDERVATVAYPGAAYSRAPRLEPLWTMCITPLFFANSGSSRYGIHLPRGEPFADRLHRLRNHSRKFPVECPSWAKVRPAHGAGSLSRVRAGARKDS